MGAGDQSGAIGPAGTGAVPAVLSRPAFLARLTAAIVHEVEAEQERWFLWIAVAFGAGVALYFALGVEPPLWTLMIVAGGTALVHGFARRVEIGRASCRERV